MVEDSDNSSEDNYAPVHMREDSNAPGNRANFYLQNEIAFSSPNVAWDHLNEADTYYIFNQHYQGVATPFANPGDPELGWLREWGNRCRLGVISNSKPNFHFKASSQYVRDQGVTDFEIKADAGHWKIGRGDGFDMQIHQQEDNANWGIMRKNGGSNVGGDKDYNLIAQESNGVGLDTSTTWDTDGKDQSAKTAFQFARIYGKGADMVGASREVGMPK
eukprot:Selendium_serpulae@DN6497_c1_g1_i2.p1